MNVAELVQLQADLIAMELGPRFMGIPDRWYADGPDRPYGHPNRGARFRCVNGHVSTMVLKTEARGDRCLAADAPEAGCTDGDAHFHGHCGCK